MESDEYDILSLADQLCKGLNTNDRQQKQDQVTDMIIDQNTTEIHNDDISSTTSTQSEISYSAPHNDNLVQSNIEDHSHSNNINKHIEPKSLYRSSSLPVNRKSSIINQFKDIEKSIFDPNIIRKTPCQKINTNMNNLNNYKQYDCDHINILPIVNTCSSSSTYNNERLPIYINGYIQLIFNISLVIIILYGLCGLMYAIRNDIESKIQISVRNLMEEMTICSRQYADNKCNPNERVPALETKCIEWEKCMNQDPAIIARRSSFTAQTIGEILNTFLDQLSWKSAILIFGGLISLFIGFNLAFSIGSNTFYSKKKEIRID
ncbi:hypothetical protein cand_028540 [Cryptosporidium andersoni]|uniref:Brl1/Brr6 domain-containing protein n=1 Tax=Cryptosporidium andersoni TaxID=117008 RepID=A0A1J4MT74_9CRYT|nr:hypothetical protein cand_028540 [Cryptosporidium andersoni]